MNTVKDYVVGILITFAIFFASWIIPRIASKAFYKSKREYLKNLVVPKKEDKNG